MAKHTENRYTEVSEGTTELEVTQLTDSSVEYETNGSNRIAGTGTARKPGS